MDTAYRRMRAWCAFLLSAAVFACCPAFSQDQPGSAPAADAEISVKAAPVSAPAGDAPAAAPSPAAPAAVSPPPSGALTLYFLDIDQGDSTLIYTPSGKAILIDGGRGGSGYKRKDKGRTVIIPFLKEKGIKKLDMVIMTHADEDHIGGLVTVVNETKPESGYPVEIVEFLDPGQAHTTYLYKELLNAVMDRKEIKYRNSRSGEKLDFGEGVIAEVLNPPDVEGKTSNAASIVLKVAYGGVSFLLTGDAEASAERYMLDTYKDKLKSTVLKAGHHGSGASSSDAFLAAVKPEVVVISVGTKNKFLLPDKNTLNRFEATGAKIYRTDYQGTITVTTDGKGYKVSTEREVPPLKDRWDFVPTLSEDEKMDINSASAAELEKLPRIGKGLAAEIIKRRPYQKVDDLRRVPGIGVKILERLRPLVKAVPPAEPAPGAVPAGEGAPEAKAPAGGAKVNVNSASAEELAAIPGVSPALANAIIAGRPYRDTGELRNVPGIGPAKLEKILPHVSVSE